MKPLALKMIFLTILAALFYSFAARSATPDMVVAKDGSGDFTTIQKAIDAVPSDSDRPTVILIKRGVYNTEKLIIPADKKNVTFLGESREETIISYHIYDCSEGKCPSADAAKWTGDNIRTSATLTIMGDGFRAENLTIQNTAGPVGQAQAITVQADKVVFINCNLTGYQDTIYLWSSGKRSYFESCLVVGRTDYIYGGGIAFFNRCEIRSWGGGWITAPSTQKSQTYGFVFSECQITYATDSPRAGDDGNPFRFGRPWNDYPKVAWLFCNLSGMLNPQGWGDTWNMSYAATSTDLHLYEYRNTGLGADMSGRASWAGLRALTDAEAQNYTTRKVMAGSDNWDPTAQAPMVRQYIWTGKGADNNWLTSGNWFPDGIPALRENAVVNGNYIIMASGNFPADLSLSDSTRIEVIGKAATTYLSAKGTRILANGNDTLSGKIAIRDSLIFDLTGKLTLKANLSGIHQMVKTGSGHLFLTGDNGNFSGGIEIRSGTLEASTQNSLGKGSVDVKSRARLIVGDKTAFYAKARLTAATDAYLELKTDVTTSEFYIGTKVQPVGEYSSVTNPGLISGTGKVIVGRPSVFIFTGATSGVWDIATNYSPTLLPKAGETVICEKEIETTSTVFSANLILRGAGRLRLRGNHKATGTITMEQGTVIAHSTSGTGMALDAPLQVEGDVEMIMESASTSGSSMKLEGPVSGNAIITPLNNGRGTVNTGTLVLKGDNSHFTGKWNLTKYSAKYPSVQGYQTRLEGAGEYAFGPSVIDAALKSRVIISHAKAASPVLTLNLRDSAKLVIQVPADVTTFVLNGQIIPDGIYSASSHPQFFEGTGTLTVGSRTGLNNLLPGKPAVIHGHELQINGRDSRILIYNILGINLASFRNVHSVALENLPPGIYLIRYIIDKCPGVLKFTR